MKNNTPLIPLESEDINKVIWEELRMITMLIADIKLELDKNTKTISSIENRMVTTYDFENGISKICEILKQIERNTERH